MIPPLSVPSGERDIKLMKYKRLSSLHYKQVVVFILGALISLLMFFITQSVGDYVISKMHKSQDSAFNRLTKYQDSFEQYIHDNHVSVKNIRAISKWVKSHKYVYVTIYSGEEIIYESGFWNDSYSSYETNGSLMESTPQTERNISFTDGTYSVSILDSSEIKWYNVSFYISWGFFFFSLFMTQILYNRRIIDRIVSLSREVSLIEQGDLEQPIHHKGNDEISLLAKNADNMRHSILTRYVSEKEAWDSNRELITSMSHDIRTPLTSLIGYLEILDTKGYHSDEQFHKYIRSCWNKALQLKNLSDQLFQYFLVFGKETILMELELFDANILLPQLLSEQIYDSNTQRYELKTEFADVPCIIRVDVSYLKRLFDNLFSNIQKYADPDDPVEILVKKEENNLLIFITNSIQTDGMFKESTNIGLKTCKKIVEQMRGTFEISKINNQFRVCTTFPIELTKEKIQ